MALYIVASQYKRDEFRVHAMKAEGIPLLVAVLTLQETDKGLRPLRVRVVKEKEDEYLPVSKFVDLLKAADGIFATRMDPYAEGRFNEMLEGYQLSSQNIGVCRFCMLEDRITFKKSDMVRFKDEFICMDCAKKELRREVEFKGRMTRAGIERLESLLLKTKDLGRIIALLSPSNLPPELTRYDLIPATQDTVKAVKVKDLDLDPRFKEILSGGMAELMPVQSRSVHAGLLQGQSQLVVSATATGKTLIGELAGINNCLRGRGKMLFLVPLVALANQKYEQFKKRYSPVLKTGIRVGTSRIALRAKMNVSLGSDIVVGTYEALDYVLRRGEAQALKKVGTVVIDEVHMLEDEERGHRLDGTIARLRAYAPDAQFIFLSATIGNPKEVAKHLGAKLVEYEHRPVPLERHLIFASGHEKDRLIEEYASKEYAQVSKKGFHGQTIVFTNSRKKCHSISQSLRIQSAPYHAGLTYQQRKSVEDRFANGDLKVVVTTAALAAGVDFPASQVIFETLAMGNDWVSVGEFQQMQGRAGRPDYHDMGKVVVLADPDSSLSGQTEEEVAFRLLGGGVEHVNVIYDEPQQLEECLANACVVSTEKEIERMNDRMLGISASTKALIDKAVSNGLMAREKGLIRNTPLGKAIATHFLSVEDAFLIRDRIYKKYEPLDIAVELEPFDAVYFRNAERLSRVIGVNVPSRALSPSALDIVFSGEALAKMDKSMQAQFMDFSQDFLNCECSDAPFCGCPERKFSKKIVEYRLQGKDPRGISRAIAYDYNLSAFDGDLLGYLDRLTRNLDAIHEIARILGKGEAAKEARALGDDIENADDGE
jgi:helicase